MVADLPCPEVGDWQRYLYSAAPEAEWMRFAEHAAECQRCQMILNTLRIASPAPEEPSPPVRQVASPPAPRGRVRRRRPLLVGTLALLIGVGVVVFLGYSRWLPKACGPTRPPKAVAVAEPETTHADAKAEDRRRAEEAMRAAPVASVATSHQSPPAEKAVEAGVIAPPAKIHAPPVKITLPALSKEREEPIALPSLVPVPPISEDASTTGAPQADRSTLPPLPAPPPLLASIEVPPPPPPPPVLEPVAAGTTAVWTPELVRVGASNREVLPPPEVDAPQPTKEPVAVLGEARLRHWEDLTCVAYSADGKTLAGGGGSRGLAVVRLWDTTTVSEREVLRVETASEDGQYSGIVAALAYAPDGKRLAARCDNGTVCLWNIGKDGAKLWAKLEGDSPGAVAFSGDGNTLAVGCETGRVQLWDLDRRRPSVRDVLKGLEKTVGDVAYSPDGKTLAAISDQGTFRLWSVDGAEPIAVSSGAVSAASSADSCRSKRTGPRECPKVGGDGHIAFAPDGKALATLHEGRLSLWKRTAGDVKLVVEWPREWGELKSFTFMPKGTIWGSDGMIRNWDLNAKGEVTGYDAIREGYPERPVAFDPKGKSLAVVYLDEQRIGLRPSNSLSGCESPLAGHAKGVSCGAFLPGDKCVVTVGQDKSFLLWNLADQKPKEFDRGRSGDARWVVPSPDGNSLAFLDTDTGVRVRALSNPDAETPLIPFEDTVKDRPGRRSVVFADDGESLAVGNFDGTIHVWAPGWGTAKKRCVLKGHKVAVSAMAYRTQGKLLVSGDEQGYVYVWNLSGVKAPTIITTRRAGTGRVAWVEALKADCRVATVEADHVRVWQMSYAVGELKPVREAVLQGKKEGGPVVFSADGELAAAVETGDQVALWSTVSGKRLATWHFSGTVHDVTFSPGGQYLLTSNANGTASLFRLHPPPEAAQAVSRREP